MRFPSKIKERVRLLLRDIKSFKKLDADESYVDTTSQMSIEELIKIGEETFSKYDKSSKPRQEDLLELVNSYLNIGRQWERHFDKKMIKTYIEILGSDDMQSISAKEAVEALETAMKKYKK